MKCKETLFDHPYPWTTQHLLRTIYNIVNEEKYKIYYNGEKLKQIEATKKTPYRSGVHQKSQMKVTILPRQQSKPQYQTWGKTYGTTTNPKKTQRAATTKPPPWGRKTTHTPKANRNPMPQRVIHPTNKTPASSSLANFKVQQASRIKRSIFATLVVIQRATTDTKFSKGTWHQK